MTLLSESIENYERAINDDVQTIINIFREQYCTMIENFSVYKNNIVLIVEYLLEKFLLKK